MIKRKEIQLSDDNNRRDRDNKADREDIRKFQTTESRRGDIKGGGRTQAARAKKSTGKK